MTRRNAIKQAALIMGTAVSASTIAGLMSGCSAFGTPIWKPLFLTEDQGELVATIAELILPATDIPGARDALVHEFIDVMLANYMEEEEQKRFLAGLTQVEVDAQTAYSKNFMACSTEEQTEMLTTMASEAASSPQSFFRKIKELTLVGYFTSETVGKNVLNFLPVPGTYEACISIEEVGNVNWTI